MFIPGESEWNTIYLSSLILFQILKPAEKKAKYAYNAMGGKNVTPPRSKGKKKEGRMS